VVGEEEVREGPREERRERDIDEGGEDPSFHVDGQAIH